MIRPGSWLLPVLLGTLGGALGCTGSEPSNELAKMPDLVYTEHDESNGSWTIFGYWEGEGAREIAPGPAALPRPVYDFLLVRPTTGELLYQTLDPEWGYILLNPASGQFRRLELPGQVQDWSPTGDLLTTVLWDVHLVVTMDGAVRATVCSPPVTCGVHHWAPRGDALVGFREPAGGDADLWRVPMDGGPERNLTKTAFISEIGGFYSPDGQYLAYWRRPYLDLVVANADGGDARPLIAPIGFSNFSWSPHGGRVALDAMVGDQGGVVLVSLAGDPPRLITPPGENLNHFSDISWSPDGGRLVYGALDGTARNGPGVFVINVDGSGRRQLSTPGGIASRAAWIPDVP